MNMINLDQPLLKKEDDQISRSVQLVDMQLKSREYQSEATINPDYEEIKLQKNEKIRATFLEYLNKFPTFNPDNWLIILWKIIILLLVIFYFYIIPVMLFFGYDIVRHDLDLIWLKQLVISMTVVLAADVFVSFNTGYYDKGLLISDKYQIFIRYFTEDFFFDIVPVIAIILQLSYQDDYAYLVWVPFLFYLKIYFVLSMDEKMFQILQLQRKAKAAYQFIRLILSVLFIVHFCACLFYAAGAHTIRICKLEFHIYSCNTWLLQSGLQDDIYLLPYRIQYEYAFYWAITTMLTVGYGDITGKNPMEVFVSIITMLFSCVIFAILINAFQQVFSEINANNMNFEKKMTDINRFMRDKNIDYQTQQKVRRFFTFIQSEKVKDFQEQINLINQLAPQLKDEVIMQSYGYILRRIYWVTPFSYDFQKKMAYLVIEQMYSNGEVIFKQNVNSQMGNNDDDCLYYISIGGVNLQIILEDENVLLFSQLLKDNIFGEISFLTGNIRTLSAQCTSITQLYKIKRQDFLQMMLQFPQEYQSYCMLRDKILLRDYAAININCFICSSTSHLAYDCSKSHYNPNKLDIIRNAYSTYNDRGYYKRNQQKHQKSSLIKILSAQLKVTENLDLDSDKEAPTPYTARQLTFDRSLSQVLDQSDSDLVSEIVNRLDKKRQQRYIEIDQGKENFKKINMIKILRSLFSTTKAREPLEPPYLELQRDFLDPAEFYQLLGKQGVQFYTGVPDSLLKDFCAYVADNTTSQQHVIAANEGTAVSLAAGYHLATNRIPCVYLQNSGLGNLVNPYMSLAHPKVYGIPILFLIGWRGEPGKKDEPQHLVQGKRMNGILTEMGMQYDVLPDYIEGAQEALDTAFYSMRQRKGPYALLVRRQCFTNYKLQSVVKNSSPLNREQALEVVINMINPMDVCVSTTGFMSRELFELRQKYKQTGEQDFLTVGSMGHASSIALGIAITKKSRQVFCLDGDGAAIMHLGALTQVGSLQPKNYKHILFNNQAHDSVGAQPTSNQNLNFQQIALGCGYRDAFKATNEVEIKEQLQKLIQSEGPSLLEIMIKPGARKDLGRPTSSTFDNKEKFMTFLQY
ncbi:hypothetical protein pb186bvf_009139 [Paramecium bursaria]